MSMHEALGKLIHNLNPYSQDMQFPQPQASETATAGKTQVDQDVAQIPVEIDDYKGEWTFRGHFVPD